MRTYGVAEAKRRLSKLIDCALEGESVVITRRGRPVVELRPVAAPVRQLTREDLDWLAARRVGRAQPGSDAGALVSSMRDDDRR